MYAHRSASAWSIEAVDTTWAVGFYASLALDASDNPHIAYFSTTYSSLNYAFKSGGAWTRAAVDTAGSTGHQPQIEIDGDGRPHIAYFDLSNKTIKYAYLANGEWIFSVIDTVGGGAERIGLGLDGSGNPHVSYYKATTGDLMYATAQIPTTVGGGVRAAFALSAWPNPSLGGRTRIIGSLGACGPCGAASAAGEASTGGAFSAGAPSTGSTVGIADAELAIFDPSGRLVRALVRGSWPAGGAVVWDGRDASGAPVASGRYLLVLRAGERSIATRLTVIR